MECGMVVNGRRASCAGCNPRGHDVDCATSHTGVCEVMPMDSRLTAAMRDWLRDCADCYTDITEDDVDDLPRATVWRIVERDYDGGVDGFIRDSA